MQSDHNTVLRKRDHHPKSPKSHRGGATTDHHQHRHQHLLLGADDHQHRDGSTSQPVLLASPPPTMVRLGATNKGSTSSNTNPPSPTRNSPFPASFALLNDLRMQLTQFQVSTHFRPSSTTTNEKNEQQSAPTTKEADIGDAEKQQKPPTQSPSTNPIFCRNCEIAEDTRKHWILQLSQVQSLSASERSSLLNQIQTLSARAISAENQATDLSERNAFLLKQLRDVESGAKNERATLQRHIHALQAEIARTAGAAGLAHDDTIGANIKLQDEVKSLKVQIASNEARVMAQAAQFHALQTSAAERDKYHDQCEKLEQQLTALSDIHQRSLAENAAAKEQLRSDRDVALDAHVLTQQQVAAGRVIALTQIRRSADHSTRASIFADWKALGVRRVQDRKVNDALHHEKRAMTIAKGVEEDFTRTKRSAKMKEDSLHDRIDSLRKTIREKETTIKDQQDTIQHLKVRVGGGAGGNDEAVDKRGTSGGGGGKSSSSSDAQMVALECYSVLQPALFGACERLKLNKVIQVRGLRMHEQPTESLASSTLKWAQTTAGQIHTFFSLEDRLSKQRYKLICLAITLRAKLAQLALRLSLPVGNQEATLLRTQKTQFDDVLHRIQGLRARIESLRQGLYTSFNPHDVAISENRVSVLETEVADFLKRAKLIERGQFQMSLMLVKLNLQEREEREEEEAEESKEKEEGDNNEADDGSPLKSSAKKKGGKGDLQKSSSALSIASPPASPSAATERGHTPKSLPPVRDGGKARRSTLDESRALLQSLGITHRSTTSKNDNELEVGVVPHGAMMTVLGGKRGRGKAEKDNAAALVDASSSSSSPSSTLRPTPSSVLKQTMQAHRQLDNERKQHLQRKWKKPTTMTMTKMLTGNDGVLSSISSHDEGTGTGRGALQIQSSSFLSNAHAVIPFRSNHNRGTPPLVVPGTRVRIADELLEAVHKGGINSTEEGNV